jgi:hypothetical protein
MAYSSASATLSLHPGINRESCRRQFGRHSTALAHTIPPRRRRPGRGIHGQLSINAGAVRELLPRLSRGFVACQGFDRPYDDMRRDRAKSSSAAAVVRRIVPRPRSRWPHATRASIKTPLFAE